MEHVYSRKCSFRYYKDVTPSTILLNLFIVLAEASVKIIAYNTLPIKEGDSIAFECVKTLNNKAVNVLRWERDNQPIDSCSGARIIPPGTYHKFYIQNARMTDTGVYQCVAEIEGKVKRANQTISIVLSGQQTRPIFN